MENPTTNTTTPGNPPYKWMGEPKQRGTYGIISLCFSTLIICIWSTVHFNVPTRRCTVTRRVFGQVFWMIFALLAPEALLFFAIYERIMASLTVKKVLKFHQHLAKPGIFIRMYNSIYNLIHGRADTPQPHFGLVHAFYATMGGFAFCGSYDGDTPKSLFEISTNPDCTIEVPRFDAFMYIMEHFPHIITDITEEDILDRAASSSLSKALLIVQVAWFCTNCASRLFQRLPLSLLEVSTAAHALCTLLTYFVWLSKPLNVPSPTLLREKEALEVYALFKCEDAEYDKALKMAKEMAKERAVEGSSMPTGLGGSEKIVLAAGALQHLLPTPARPPRSSVFYDSDDLLPININDYDGPDDDGGLLVMTIVTSPILYGLAHFLAWSDQFPTPLERLLWHISSFVVTCSGLIAIFLMTLGGWCKDRNDIVGSKSYALTTFICAFIVPLSHVLASGFLIVESVRQLLFLDDAAYQLPAWSNYWPHLS